MFHKTLALFLALAVVFASAFSQANANEQGHGDKEGETVVTKSGRLQGGIALSRDGRQYHEWLGVPYAEPPIGDLRFKAPKPVQPWTGVREATKYGSQCAQLEYYGNKQPIGEEDCLFLNIHTPKKVFDQAKSTKALRPVMVWIHGGYLSSGSGNDYSPVIFMDEDIVLVTINYRLNIFGFLSTGDGVLRGNMGLKDQALALRWIKENIAEFGGNPDQITIFGESAGGISVHYQVISPLTKGLFNRAISQSGNVFLTPAITKKTR